MNQQRREQFAETAVHNLGQVFQGEELDALRSLFDTDRTNFRYFWHDYGHHQYVNYDALVTTPRFDELIRHPPHLARNRRPDGRPGLFRRDRPTLYGPV